MKILAVCRRELYSLFYSLIAYILLAVFLVVSGYYFYSDLIFFILFGGAVLPTGLWQYFFYDMCKPTMIVLPLVTTRLFAEEKKLGTIELLWTYPVRDGEIIAGKFLAALLFFIIMLIPTIVGPLLFYRVHAFEAGPLLAGYCGIFLMGTAFIAYGMFISSLTENQVVATIVTWGTLVFLWFMTWNEEAVNQEIIRYLLALSLFDHFYGFMRGVIDTRDVIFFLTFTVFFIFITLLSLTARKWRGVR